MPPSQDPRLSGREAFAHPDFLKYTFARFLLVVSLEMLSVAVGWQVYEITNRPLDLGHVGLAQFLPGFALFLFAGSTFPAGVTSVTPGLGTTNGGDMVTIVETDDELLAAKATLERRLPRGSSDYDV